MKIKIKIKYKDDKIEEFIADSYPYFENGFLNIIEDRENNKTTVISDDSIEKINYERLSD